MGQRNIFGEKLKQYRQARDLTQAELARLTGYAVSTIRKLESGVLRPSRQLAEHVASILALDASASATFVTLSGKTVLPDKRALPFPDNTVAAPQRPRQRAAFPGAVTPLIGRDQEVHDLKALLIDSSSRLITLHGAGGSGKTRLAVEIAYTLNAAFRDGSAFVSLASLQNPAAMVFALAGALQLPLHGGADPRVQLLDYLSSKQLLLILDNYEHLLPATDLPADLLRFAPEVKLLVTSRERIALPDEMLFDLAGLAYPAGKSNDDPSTFGAVQLFVQRARQANRHFVFTAEIAAAVSRICAMIDGLPLAIELVAAAVREHTCVDIADNIERMLWDLSPGWQDTPDRHRNLRAVFDYSWLLLDEAEQSAFGRLSVFRSSFDHTSARMVADVSPALLERLLSKSMLRQYTDGSYGMHELTRQYAAQRLAENSSQLTHTHDRHCRYFAERLAPHTRTTAGGNEEATLRLLRAKIGDVRAAWEWAVLRGNTTAIDQLIDGVFQVYETLGFFREGEQLFRLAREGVEAHTRQWSQTTPEQQRTLANVMARQAALLFRLDEYAPAAAILEQSLVMLQAVGKPADHAFVLLQQGRVAWATSNYNDAHRHYLACRELAHAIGDAVTEAQCMAYTGTIEDAYGNFDAARRCYEQSLKLFQGLEHYGGCAYALQRLGLVAECLGNYDEAQHFFTQSLSLRQELDDQWGIAQSLCCIGHIAILLQRYDEATRIFEKSLQRFEEIGDRWGVAFCYIRQAQIACRIGLFAEARTRADEGFGIFDAINDRWGLAYALRTVGTACAGLGLFNDAERYLLRALAIAHRIHLVPRILDILMSLASVWVATGDRDSANTLLRIIIEHPASWAATRSDAVAVLQEAQVQTVGATVRLYQQAGSTSSLSDVLDVLLSGGNYA